MLPNIRTTNIFLMCVKLIEKLLNSVPSYQQRRIVAFYATGNADHACCETVLIELYTFQES